MAIELIDDKLVIDNIIVKLEHINFTDKPIKSGNSGVVLFGTDSILNRKIAIKFWRAKAPNDARPKDVQGQLEAMKSAQLNNPYFAQIFSANYLHGYFYAIQEYVDGISLNDWLARKPSLSFRIGIWNEIVDAVKFLHKQGIYHGDLHGKNIFVIESKNQLSSIKIIDFGTSRLNGNVDISYSRKRESRVFWKTSFKIFPEYQKYAKLITNNSRLSPEAVVEGLDAFIKIISELFERESKLDGYGLRQKLLEISMWVSEVPLFELSQIMELVKDYLNEINIEETFDAMRFFLDNLPMCIKTIDDGEGRNYINLEEDKLLDSINLLYQKRQKEYLSDKMF